MPSRAFWLVMTFDAPSPPTAGEDCFLKVITSNVGIGHNFPSAPLDLIEAWLNVRVTSEKGRRIYESGRLDQSGRLESGAHKLGGFMLDKDGNKIERNRVWVTAKKVTERAIPPGSPIPPARAWKPAFAATTSSWRSKP